jgi:hypothetical protein
MTLQSNEEMNVSASLGKIGAGRYQRCFKKTKN